MACGGSKSTVNDLATANPISTSINLSAVTNDKAPVVINPGRFTEEKVTFRLPKVVQGTYSISDFGKYIDDFKALDYDGKELLVSKADDNTWNISNGKSLDKLTYLVNDTYDTEGEHEEAVFSPSGTNILKGKNFVLNLHGF